MIKRRCGKGGTPGHGMKTLGPFPTPCPIHLFYPGVSERYPFIVNWLSSKQNISLSFVSFSGNLIKPKKRHWKPLTSKLVRSRGNKLGLQVVSEVVCGVESFPVEPDAMFG